MPKFTSLCLVVPLSAWDKAVGLAVSLLHRFGVDDKHDPTN